MTGTSRFARLSSYLAQDPGNPSLLQDAFAAACAESLWDEAQALVQSARTHGLDAQQWALNNAHLLMAQQQWPEATVAIQALQRDPQLGPQAQLTLATDLAQIQLRQGQIEEGIASLEPFVNALAATDALDSSTEETWARLLHRAGDLDRVMGWGREREQARTLTAGGAGVMSLAAVDASQFAEAQRWSALALAAQPMQLEAGLTRATLALADADQPRQALQLSEHLAQGRSHDGRVWSTLAMAKLLNQDLPGARQAFEQATTLMPTHIGTWHGLAWTALLQGDTAFAEATFEHALQMDRNFAESHGGLAVIWATTGRREEAQQSVRRALGLDPSSATAHYAQLLLDEPVVDGAKLRGLAERLFGDQAGPSGRSLVSVLARIGGRG
ncbi:MAG TPA: tetratricopeptide repeat protein [Burkholderiaceae bacterium]